MFFASDNAGPAHPKVIEAVMRANDGYAMPYGAEDAMARVRGKLRDLLGMPNAAIYLVATGTATNALMLATMCKPFQTIFCSEVAHIEEDECGAPEFFTSGAKLTLVDAPQAKMTAEHLREAIDSTADGVVHGVQRGPVSITTVTERGTVYTLDEQKALVNVAREYGLPVHLDGARFANAVASLGCTAADMAQGFDAISFGATKNGCMGSKQPSSPIPPTRGSSSCGASAAVTCSPSTASYRPRWRPIWTATYGWRWRNPPTPPALGWSRACATSRR